MGHNVQSSLLAHGAAKSGRREAGAGGGEDEWGKKRAEVTNWEEKYAFSAVKQQDKQINARAALCFPNITYNYAANYEADVRYDQMRGRGKCKGGVRDELSGSVLWPDVRFYLSSPITCMCRALARTWGVHLRR